MLYYTDSKSPYLQTSVEFILKQDIDIDRITIIMPSGTLCYYFKELLKVKLAQTSLLPEIIPITRLQSTNNTKIVKPYEQTFILATIISNYAPLKINFLNALKLSNQLGSLFAEFSNNNISFEDISKAASNLDESEHWQIIQDFLQFSLNEYQKYLQENDKIDFAKEQKTNMEKFSTLVENSDRLFILAGFIVEDELIKELLQKLAPFANCKIIMPPLYNAQKNIFDIANFQQNIPHLNKQTTKEIRHIKSDNIFEEAKNIVRVILDNIKTSKIVIVTQNSKLITLLRNLLWQHNIEINNHITQNISVKNIVSCFIKFADLVQTTLLTADLIQILNCPYVVYKIFELESKLVHAKHHYFSVDKLIEFYKNDYPYLSYLQELLSNIKHYQYFSEFLTSHLAIFDHFVGQNKLPQNFLNFLNELKILLNTTKVSQDDYCSMLKDFIANHNFSEKLTNDTNIIISPAKEALIIDSDIVIIPQFIDKIWPGSFHEDPWLTPDIRKSLNLQNEKFHIELSYDIFTCLSNRNKLYITHSEYYEGKAVVVSRFLSMINDKVIADNIYVENTFKEIEKFNTEIRCSNFPDTISASSLELLIRNPYGFYLYRILHLAKFKYLYEINLVNEFGNFIHKVIELYTKNFITASREILYKNFINIAQNILDEEDYVFRDWWLHKIYNLALEFIDFDLERRIDGTSIFSEKKGLASIKLSNGKIQNISAIADRIELCANNIVHILDYKTGSIASKKDIDSGVAIQLIVNAIIAYYGGFDDIPKAKYVKLYYVKIANNLPYIKLIPIEISKEDIEKHENAMSQFFALVTSDEANFVAHPNSLYSPKYDDYKHMARLQI